MDCIAGRAGDVASTPASDVALDLAADLDALADLSPPELRARWLALKGEPVPRVRPGILRLALAYELQAAAVGALPRRTVQRLDQIAAGRTRTEQTRPGMKLVREWQGKLYTVAIGPDGAVHWEGKAWKSLSEVARAITGTRWSGPAFFGLRKRIAA